MFLATKQIEQWHVYKFINLLVQAPFPKIYVGETNKTIIKICMDAQVDKTVWFLFIHTNI